MGLATAVFRQTISLKMNYGSEKFKQNKESLDFDAKRTHCQFWALNDCAKFHENGLKLMIVGAQTDRQTDRQTGPI